MPPRRAARLNGRQPPVVPQPPVAPQPPVVPLPPIVPLPLVMPVVPLVPPVSIAEAVAQMWAQMQEVLRACTQSVPAPAPSNGASLHGPTPIPNRHSPASSASHNSNAGILQRIKLESFTGDSDITPWIGFRDKASTLIFFLTLICFPTRIFSNYNFFIQKIFPNLFFNFIKI